MGSLFANIDPRLTLAVRLCFKQCYATVHVLSKNNGDFQLMETIKGVERLFWYESNIF